MRIDIVADVVCPWCFIGKRRLERALAMRPDARIERAWRPFQLNPEMPVDGLPRDLYLRVKFGAGRSAAMAQTAIQVAGLEEGIEFDFERIERTPNTLNAHRLISFAQRHGCDNAVIDALFQGYFTKGLDVGDIDTLAVIADGCGLDEAVARQYLSHGSGTSEALAEEHRARRAGIHAVPCFIFDGGYAVAGAQDPAVFLPLLDLAAIVGGRIQAEA